MKVFLRVLYIILGVSMVGMGFSCMFSPVYSSTLIGYFVGFSILFDGIGMMVKWSQSKKDNASDPWLLTGAILAMVFGFFIVNSAILALSIDVFYVYYVSVWFIIQGILGMVRAFRAHRFHKAFETRIIGADWGMRLVLSILLVAFGILCLFKPLITAAIIGIFIGLGVIFAGCYMINFGVVPHDRQSVDKDGAIEVEAKDVDAK